LIDIRLSLAQAAKQSRVQHALPQTELAKRMKSSQSRIAKIEAADTSVFGGLNGACAADQWCWASECG
jgi:transcriptional regulator with XRE-family HTH domain